MRSSLAETIAEQIEQRILDGELPRGSRLPTEGDMATQFGVSRPSVREAIATLKGRSLIRSVDGGHVVEAGTVGLVDALTRQLKLTGVSPRAIANLYHVRRMLEVAAAGSAAQSATPEDVAAVQGWLSRMRESMHDQDAWAKSDVGFHISIAAATHNPFVVSMLEPLTQLIECVIYEGYRSPHAVDVGLAKHVALAEAIARSDAAGSEQAMREMLERSEQYVLSAMDARLRRDERA